MVVLDRGFGADEEEHCALLMADIRDSGVRSIETFFPAGDFPTLSHGVIALECGIGEMAALISHSDEYIGYDSACQHIAAAADADLDHLCRHEQQELRAALECLRQDRLPDCTRQHVDRSRPPRYQRGDRPRPAGASLAKRGATPMARARGTRGSDARQDNPGSHKEVGAAVVRGTPTMLI